jgi:hypothetical protein
MIILNATYKPKYEAGLARAKTYKLDIRRSTYTKGVYHVESSTHRGIYYGVVLARVNGSPAVQCECNAGRRDEFCQHAALAIYHHKGLRKCSECGQYTGYTVAHPDTDYCISCLSWSEEIQLVA